MLSLSETRSGSCERVASEARHWEMRGSAMCLEGRIQRRENLWANLRAGRYRQNSIIGSKSGGHSASGGATVLMMETADMRKGDDLSLLR